MAYQAESPSATMAPRGAGPASIEPPGPSLVVWRTWLLAPERGPRSTVRPLLTGLYGFPWPSDRIEAKCTMRDRAGGYLATGASTLDRHHRVIPDPNCTCGIYAGRDELANPRSYPVRGVPFVTGFVALHGRVLATTEGFRAQQAHIVGPLTITPGRPPLSAAVALRMRAPLVPSRITTGPAGYQTLWRTRPTAGLGVWLADTAAQLTDRYGVAVMASSERTRVNPPRG